jgi:N-acetylmuramoyl-L-alanine amidase-like protein
VTYRWLTDLDVALADAGIDYTPVGYSSLDPTGAADWRSRGRPASTGEFDPGGVLCHHTASPAGTTDAGDINVILAGNSEAPGPISQLYIGRTATVYLIAAGRANHGGRGALSGAGCDDMNAALIGIEAGNDGMGERWPDALTAVYARVTGALCDHYGWTTADVYLHATTGPPCGNAKIDPAGPWERQPNLAGGGAGTWDLTGVWRPYVDECRALAPPPSEVDDMGIAFFQPSDADARFIGYRDSALKAFLSVQWATVDLVNRWTPLNPPTQDGTVAQLASMMLLGPLPQGDSRHHWTGDEFAAVVT